MTIRIDPEGRELRALRHAVDFRRRDVLEIGCGDGRLTRRYAHLARHVYAMDADCTDIRAARHQLPDNLSGRVEFHCGDATKLRLPRERFDIALLAWSL